MAGGAGGDCAALAHRLGQYAGFLHAGLIGALADTACELFAANGAEEKLLASGETLLTVARKGG